MQESWQHPVLATSVAVALVIQSRVQGVSTGFSSQIGTKLRDLAVGQAGAGCYAQAVLSTNDSKTLYIDHVELIIELISLSPV